jgi:hypothetical protein
MANTVAGLVEKPADAQRIIDDLQSTCLCDRSDISVMHRDAAQVSSAVKTAVDKSAAAASSVVAALFAGANAVSRSLPGGGMLRATGKFAASVADAGVQAGAGLTKALIEAGVPKEHAERYGDAMRRGEILIIVQAHTDKIAQCARTVMTEHGAVEPESRVTQ